MFLNHGLASQFLSKLDEKRGYTEYWVKMCREDKKAVKELLNEKDKERIKFLEAADLLFAEKYEIEIK